jgi:hypothetical protein
VLLVAAALVPAAAGAADRGADGKFEKRTSSHFVLYQDVDIDETGGLYGTRRFEQRVIGELERAYDQLDARLGLRPSQRIQVVVYDPGAFDASFRGLFRFAAAGFYAGVIRVRGGTQMTVPLSRVLHHELVHAALHDASPSFVYPGWLNEGLAEWFEARTQGKRHLSGAELSLLSRARNQGALVPLASLSAPSFARFGPDAARVAYLQSYGMVEYLARGFGERRLRDFCLAVVRGRDVERALRRTYRIGLQDLEARFASEL